MELNKCFWIIVNTSCIFALSLALFLNLLKIKLVRNVPSPFPSFLELVQHGLDLSLGGVLSPIINPFIPAGTALAVSAQLHLNRSW